jgi:hypothetical protein
LVWFGHAINRQRQRRPLTAYNIIIYLHEPTMETLKRLSYSTLLLMIYFFGGDEGGGGQCHFFGIL